MKRIIFPISTALLLFALLAVSSLAADVSLDASFEDGFSEDSGKLAVTVKNVSDNIPADVTVNVSLPEGASSPQTSVVIPAVGPGDSFTKDFVVTFEAPSFFATHKMLIIAGAVFLVTLAVFIVAMIRRPKKSPPPAAMLALALIPAALLCTRAFAADQATKTLTVKHAGREYGITVTASATDAVSSEASPEEDMTTPAPPQTGDPALSRPFRNTRRTDPNAEYNTPVVNANRIKEGAGPLGPQRVYVGKNDFMFFGEEADYFTGASVLDDKTVEQIAKSLTRIKDKAAENGIDVYVLICPNKSTVYSDYVPEKLAPAAETSRTKLVRYLAENTGLNVTDATDALIAARAEYGDSLYYKYDTHWTQHGGYIAYRELIRTIRRDHPETVFYSSEYFDVNEYETYMKDNLYYLGFYDAYSDFGPVYSLKHGPEAELTGKRSEKAHGQYIFCNTFENGYRDDLVFAAFESVNTGSPKAYIMRDSFSIALVPFIKESFASSSFLWSYSAPFRTVAESGANVLVIEVVERMLGDLATARIG